MSNPAHKFAFPRPVSRVEGQRDTYFSESQEGMTLLQWYAGMALQGMCVMNQVRVSVYTPLSDADRNVIVSDAIALAEDLCELLERQGYQ